MSAIVKQKTKDDVQQTPFNPWLALFIGICAGTFAAPFIKLSQENGLPSPVIAFARMGLAALILTPLILSHYCQELKQLTLRDIVMAMFGGSLLVTHFLLMIFALEISTVLIVLVIVNTGPLWVALLERIFLKERINRFVWFGMFVTISGSIYIAISSTTEPSVNGSNPTFGAMLSLLAAMAGGAYITVGRSVRRKVSLFPYVWILFGFGGIMGLFYALATNTPILGHPAGGYFWLVMLTLIPQLIGHSGYNYALRYFTATLTSLSSQLLTVTASIVAFFIFAEVPSISDMIGSAIIAVGVIIAIVNRSKGKN